MAEAKSYLSNKSYDVLKYVAQIVMPAVATLYFALSQIWGFPYGEEIVGTLVALNAFLGVLLGLSSSAYHKSEDRFDGTIDILETDGEKLFSLNLDSDPYDLESHDEVVFKIKTKDDS